MNLDHYQLTKEECEQLVSQGIIEPITSPWACEAFYVNKRSEQVHRKLRLVINYQSLNHFLADDKFTLPRKKSLFHHLADARVLSKFDLKSGFWQLVQKKDAPSCTTFEVVKLVFTVEVHSKTHQRNGNVLADFLSRPKAYKLEENYPKDASRVQNHTPRFLSMVFSVASHEEEGSSSNTTPTIPVFDLPEEIVETIGDLTFKKKAKLCYKTFLTILLKNHGLCIKGLRFHLDYPFINIFHIHDLWRWLTTTEKETYVLVMFRRPGSFLPPKAVNDDGSVVYHAPYCFIHDWYKVNPSSRLCKRKLQTLYTDTRSLMARANSVDPDKIPYHVMWNISIWCKDHPNAYKWIEANGQWLYDNFDHCEVETSDDDDDARSLWSSDDDEHFDPFEDDPTHLDARWSP
nr:putative reverse transcriptase domain, viral movement protein [Tanacetum cinerariifolium]